jgi:hypothetical protein
MEACWSRERAAAFMAEETLGRRRYRQLATVARKRERGRQVLVTPGICRGQEASEHQTQGGMRSSRLANPQWLVSGLSVVCESL